MRVGGQCSDSEAGSYLRLIDFVYHSTLGLRVIKKKKRGLVDIPSDSEQRGKTLTVFKGVNLEAKPKIWP